MNLRARVGLTAGVLVLPLLWALTTLRAGLVARRAADALAAQARAHVAPADRARCEADPVGWIRRARIDPSGGRVRGGAPWRARMPVDAIELIPYDGDFRAAGGAGPPVPEASRAEARSRGVVTLAPGRERPFAVLAATPWRTGRCAWVLARDLGPVGRPGSWSGLPWQVVTLPAALALVVVLIALGPVVERVRRLERAVRSSAREGYRAGVPVEGDDEVAALAVAFNDAAGRVREQVALLAARERALREFLDNTTHDAMTPLTVLLGHLDALVRAPGDRAALAGAVDEAQYTASLLRNLAAVARLDGAVPEVAFTDVALQPVVERVVARHRPLATQRGMALDAGLPEAPVLVRGDVTLIEQCLSNLVQNALRHHPGGGHVAVTLDEAGAGGFVLRVLDDGAGIDAAAREALTRPVMAPGSPRSRHPEGRGLGLSIVRRVADLHGWRLSLLEGAEGRGLEARLEGAVLDEAPAALARAEARHVDPETSSR